MFKKCTTAILLLQLLSDGKIPVKLLVLKNMPYGQYFYSYVNVR